MPLTYDAISKKYFDEFGKEILVKDIAEAVDKVAQRTKKEMKEIAESFVSKKINRAEFEIQMRDKIKASHILSRSIAKGGREQMTIKDWSRVGNGVKEQYKYLNNFERKIANGQLSDAQIVSRAQLYAASGRTDYFKDFQQAKSEWRDGEKEPKARRVLNAAESCEDCIEYAALGFVPVTELPEIGDSICGIYCKCELEFEDE
jgi:hypothetical protein